MAVSMTARWDNNGTVIPGGDAEYVVAEQPIAEYDNWFNYNIVADVQAVIDDVINKFNANTILKADTDNTPAALVVAEQTIVGRKTGNSIAALTATEVRTILNVENAADVTDSTNVNASGAVMEADFNATTFLYATSDNVPQPKNVAETLAILNVDSGADVTGSNPPQAHGASRHTDRTRNIWLGAPHVNTGTSVLNGASLDDSVDEEVIYSFAIPNDFVSIDGVYVYYAASSTGGNVVLDVAAYYGNAGESTAANQEFDMTNVIAISTVYKYRLTTSGLLAAAAKDDTGVIWIKRDANHTSDTNTDDLVITGVLIEYVADM